MSRYFQSVFIFFNVFVVGVLADLLTKHFVFQSLGMPGEYRFDEPELNSVHWLWNGVLGFQTSLNAGALFGMGQGQVVGLAALSVIFMVGIVIALFYTVWQSRFLTVIFGMIAAGITGNLYDRLALHSLTTPNGEPIYAVRDWILVMLGSYPWPNFNIADSLLVCGTILLFVFSFWFDERNKKPEERVG